VNIYGWNNVRIITSHSSINPSVASKWTVKDEQQHGSYVVVGDKGTLEKSLVGGGVSTDPRLAETNILGRV